jgi:hypothetical protein
MHLYHLTRISPILCNRNISSTCFSLEDKMAFLNKTLSEEQISMSSSSDSALQTTVSHSPSEAGQTEDADKFKFLQGLTSSSKHRGKSFYGHLFNVYMHLKEQNFSKEVCDAGLFHSIYGTEFYEFHNNRITRDIVRRYIGTYAEELVYIFCSIKKDRFGTIVDNRLGLSKQQQLDLCYVEFANGWDQREHRKVDDRRFDILSQTIARLENNN